MRYRFEQHSINFSRLSHRIEYSYLETELQVGKDGVSAAVLEEIRLLL